MACTGVSFPNVLAEELLSRQIRGNNVLRVEHWLCSGSNSVYQERYRRALLYLSTLLGLAKAAPIWGAESLSNQESRNEPAESFAWIMSDAQVFVLCSQGSRYPVSALLCECSSQSSWKNKNPNSGKIKMTN